MDFMKKKKIQNAIEVLLHTMTMHFLGNPTQELIRKGVAAVTTATWIQFMLGVTIYNVWIFGKEVTPPFFTKKRTN